MNIWDFQKAVAQRLLGVNVLNMLFGATLQRTDPFLRGIGSQAMGWAGINMGIALFGSWVTQRRAKQAGANAVETVNKEKRNLSLLLWGNALLDVIYVVGGWKWAQRSEAYSFKRGNAIGIVLQGLLLFVFDVVHALTVPLQRNR